MTVVGLLLGITLFVCTVKSRSSLFACYQTNSQTEKKSTNQTRSMIIRQQISTPIDFEKNEAYGHRNDDHESYRRQTVNSSSGNDTRYSQANCSHQSPLPALKAPSQHAHVYDSVSQDQLFTAGNDRSTDHRELAATPDRACGKAKPVYDYPVDTVTQVRDWTNMTEISTTEACQHDSDEYIEVLHKSGTLL